MSSGTVDELHLYPIKSCGGVSVTSATVSDTGLAGDRQWQVSSGGKPVTQRQKSILATVRPQPIEGGLRLSAPEQPTIEVARPSAVESETKVLIGVPMAVADAGDDAAGWFATLLDDPDARLHALPPAAGVSIPSTIDVFGQRIAFGDLAPVLVANTASLDWLVERADEPFAIDRFRANIVVGSDTPFAEETWARFQVGPAELRYGMAWPRCAIPQVDQNSGERHKEPARVLAAHRKVTDASVLSDDLRRIVEGSAVFGVGCAIGPVGSEIAVGDAVTVTESQTPLLAPPS
ncbi:MAG: MOSC N-terminal beta barrel domain-containing protein [Actinomycetota bacterium]